MWHCLNRMCILLLHAQLFVLTRDLSCINIGISVVSDKQKVGIILKQYANQQLLCQTGHIVLMTTGPFTVNPVSYDYLCSDMCAAVHCESGVKV